MKKYFIFSICSECGEPVDIIDPCKELGYNAFPTTNFHGELDYEGTVALRQKLIDKLWEDGEGEKAIGIKKNTRVLCCFFNLNTKDGIIPTNNID